MSSLAPQVFASIPRRHPPEIGRTFHHSHTINLKKQRHSATVRCAGSDDSTQQQLNLSVLRFTFGIPGFDESYLPRWIGYAFGSLLVVNHFVGLESSAVTPAQFRTEVLGVSLAAFSVFVPYLGKFLKGAEAVKGKSIPEGADQIFLMSQTISDTLKEDLAWGTYVLLRNTNTVSVLISFREALCVRGYWSSPKERSNDQLRDWFLNQVKEIGLEGLKEQLYFPQAEGTELWEMLPKGTGSVLVQPVLRAQNKSLNVMEEIEGFVLLVSTSTYAYNNRDRAWTRAIANKFRVVA